MQKLLLSTLLMFITVAFLQAQVIMDENFDSYSSGDKIAQTSTTNWTTWSNAPGGAEDGTVSSAHASSGTNSLFIAKDNDCVLLLGDSTTGAYELTFKIFTPADSCTYFNILHKFDGGNSIWAGDFYGLKHDSTFHFYLQGNDTATAPYDPSIWHDYKLVINMDNDYAKLFLDGNMMFEWPWTMTSGDTSTGPNQIGGADFYGYDLYSDAKVGTYFDDIKLEKMSTVSISNSTNETSLNIYPNPTTDVVNIESNELMNSVRIYNIAGEEVMYNNTNSELTSIDISGLSNGLYYISINYGNKIIVRKIIKD
ncbi:MAG: hypothetical protein DRI86_07320 [Bacteroidetes bacterium]|nr:MAG: hypothetical protein DRI86_07320 [Bacteroidota bacterium]